MGWEFRNATERVEVVCQRELKACRAWLVARLKTRNIVAKPRVWKGSSMWGRIMVRQHVGCCGRQTA